MVATLIPITILFLFIGVPVFLALVIPSFIVLNIYLPHMEPEVLIQQMVGGVNSFSILAIPFFILAADIISNGQIGKRLMNLANALVGYFPGGLALATIVTCLFFGAISGAGSAAVVAIGGLVYPILVEKGYKPTFAIGLILSSSSLAMLIPPSIAMILFSTMAPAASVKDLFSGGMIVGFLIALAFMIYSITYAVRHKIEREKFVGFKEMGRILLKAGWALGLPAIILLGIYMGLTTVTEAAAIAVAYALFVEAIIYKGMNIKGFFDIAAKSGLVIGMLLVLIAAGNTISYVMTVAGLPQYINSLFGDYSVGIVLIILTVIFLIAGMFIDPNSAVVILVPLVTPIAFALGIDPIHLGIIVVLNLTIGMTTPPFGLNIFIAQGVFKLPYEKIIPGLLPFIVISIVMLLLITYVPELYMWFVEALR